MGIARLAAPVVLLSLFLASGLHANAHGAEPRRGEDPANGTAGIRRGSPGGLLSARRLTGIAFLGGSLVLLKKGNDYHDEADELYYRYERADRADETERLYDKTTNRDVKSQVSWALAAAFAVNGVRLVLTNGSAANAASSPSHELASRPVWIEPWLAADRLGLRLGRALGSE